VAGAGSATLTLSLVPAFVSSTGTSYGRANLDVRVQVRGDWQGGHAWLPACLCLAAFECWVLSVASLAMPCAHHPLPCHAVPACAVCTGLMWDGPAGLPACLPACLPATPVYCHTSVLPQFCHRASPSRHQTALLQVFSSCSLTTALATWSTVGGLLSGSTTLTLTEENRWADVWAARLWRGVMGQQS